MRHVLSHVTDSAPETDENTKWWAYYAVNSGLAVYYPCSFNQRSKYGIAKEISVNLEDGRKFNKPPLDSYSAHIEGTKTWGGAFWELRQLLGQAKADKLLSSSWISWRPSDPDNLRADFIRQIMKVHRSEGSSERPEQVRAIFERRGGPASNSRSMDCGRGRYTGVDFALGALHALGLCFNSRIHRFPIPHLHKYMFAVVSELEGCTGRW